jgi:hypothetical protein
MSAGKDYPTRMPAEVTFSNIPGCQKATYRWRNFWSLSRWYFVDPSKNPRATQYIWYMSRSTRRAALGTAWVASIWAGLVSILFAVLGHSAIAEVVGGGVIIFVAFSLGRPLTRLVAVESDPGKELVWNVLLVLVIVLALVGVGVMAAAITESS